jgi:hypothetical protein
VTRKGWIVGWLVVALVAGACATTQIKDAWRNPEAGPIHFQKVVALAITDDTALRRTIEDELVRAAARGNVVAAYTFIPDDEIRNVEKLKLRVADGGFDGAVVFRLVGSDRLQTWVPSGYGTPYYTLWGNYGYAWPSAVGTGTVRTDTYVTVETRVYSVANEQLVWAGRSETLNPQTTQDLVKGVVDAVAAALRKDGLIP